MDSTTSPLIKVGFLISYDYEYLKDTLPLVYPYADTITFAIDKERKTWSGESFQVPDSFFDWVREYDKDQKVSIYEDIFSIEDLKPIECDTRERNMLSEFMGEGGWHIQIDSDEYFLDFKKVIDYLKSLDYTKSIQIFARWITMFRKDEDGYYIVNTNETFPLATNSPNYESCRLSGKADERIYTDFEVLHQSWARGDEEIRLKLRNWGHKTDFNVEAYYNFWKAINKYTYKYVRSFHPLDPWLWPSLEYFQAKNIPQLIEMVKEYLIEEKRREKENNRVALKDFIPKALYKIKALIFK